MVIESYFGFQLYGEPPNFCIPNHWVRTKAPYLQLVLAPPSSELLHGLRAFPHTVLWFPLLICYVILILSRDLESNPPVLWTLIWQARIHFETLRTAAPCYTKGKAWLGTGSPEWPPVFYLLVCFFQRESSWGLIKNWLVLGFLGCISPGSWRFG